MFQHVLPCLMRATPFFSSLTLHQVEIPESDNCSQPSAHPLCRNNQNQMNETVCRLTAVRIKTRIIHILICSQDLYVCHLLVPFSVVCFITFTCSQSCEYQPGWVSPFRGIQPCWRLYKKTLMRLRTLGSLHAISPVWLRNALPEMTQIKSCLGHYGEECLSVPPFTWGESYPQQSVMI